MINQPERGKGEAALVSSGTDANYQKGRAVLLNGRKARSTGSSRVSDLTLAHKPCDASEWKDVVSTPDRSPCQGLPDQREGARPAPPHYATSDQLIIPAGPQRKNILSNSYDSETKPINTCPSNILQSVYENIIVSTLRTYNPPS